MCIAHDEDTCHYMSAPPHKSNAEAPFSRFLEAPLSSQPMAPKKKKMLQKFTKAELAEVVGKICNYEKLLLSCTDHRKTEFVFRRLKNEFRFAGQCKAQVEAKNSIYFFVRFFRQPQQALLCGFESMIEGCKEMSYD
uniref:Uncharacterized protein n=1 Tax=Fagus sylvatica TaxID=28930 RepID=A0A2N9ETS6_FAGSY